MPDNKKEQHYIQADELQKISFRDGSSRLAQFFIRLNFDNLKTYQFFRGVITAYLKQDSNMMEVIRGIQEEVHALSKNKTNRQISVENNRVRIDKKFGISDEEREEIFNILEKDLKKFG